MDSPSSISLIAYLISGKLHCSYTWTSISAQKNGPIFQTREYSQYRVHCVGHFGGPGRWSAFDVISAVELNSPQHPKYEVELNLSFQQSGALMTEPQIIMGLFL